MERAKPNPVVIGAALAVLIFSALGAAALTGVLPISSSKSDGAAALAKKTSAKTVTGTGVAANKAPVCPHCGVVESVRAIQVKGQASGLGAVAGGVTGAIVGNQFGAGNGRTAMTIAGAAGGAYAGNEIEKNVKKSTVYRIAVRMDDGSVRSISLQTAPGYAVGDRVRIVNGSQLERV